jgi:hypothetical protein
MFQILDVAAVMPAKHVGLLAVDQVCHCLDPVRTLDSCQPSILCFLYNLEDVTTFERVTVEAYAARYVYELAACITFFGR